MGGNKNITDGFSVDTGAALDNGTVLEEMYNGAINLSGRVDGNGSGVRPQGNGWDIGTYESIYD